MNRLEINLIWLEARESLRGNSDEISMRHEFSYQLMAAARKEFTERIHSCHDQCDRPICVAVRNAIADEQEACTKVADQFSWFAGAEIRARGTTE
jgi:hypothetical protein